MPRNLIEGFRKFIKSHYAGENALMKDLIQNGQDPEYFIVSCIDSRSNPATIFNTVPGAFFGHKAMGAIVRPYKKGTALAAALHFALTYNKVHTIIVLGHTHCGAVKALVDKIPDEEIASFIDVAQSGLTRAQNICDSTANAACLYRTTEEQIVLESAENLHSYPSVAKALSEGRVTIKPWLFDMQAGTLLEYNETTKTFIPLTRDTKDTACLKEAI